MLKPPTLRFFIETIRKTLIDVENPPFATRNIEQLPESICHFAKPRAQSKGKPAKQTKLSAFFKPNKSKKKD